ncbi:sensor histidine kinase [Chitinophaga nivalis]|uniref:Histidine kinase n=1 Tax=Chitinophaga nivalis TaxID=2991709 RepID=A0ABT3IRE1_9BACT|nr:histidine kinase [Chitinophaga nivalis]MCW3463787.1 histidine kinase [Chitinophaga nivalis]MCW3486523.1 histidine kinase [Chitinophaga nivalis]
MNQFRKIESGITTGVFLLLMFSLLYPSIIYNVFELQNIYGHKFAQYHQVFDYYLHYLLPAMARVILIFGCFIAVNYWIVPRFLEKQRWAIGGLLLLPVGLILFIGMMIANSYYNGYLLGVYSTVRGAHMHFAKSAFIITVFAGVLYVLYYYLRYLYLSYLHPRIMQVPLYRQIGREVLMVTSVFVVVFCLAFSDSRSLALIIFFFGPSQMAVFFVSRYKIFPEFLEQHQAKRLLWRDLTLLVLGSNFLMALICRAFRHSDAEMFFALFTLGCLISVIVVLPLSWWLLKTYQQRTDTVVHLQKALGHSAANLDFLRSQINPHFLFNALNTLYGTALQEEAARTSEGIQKLGDMMRFMLHDNHLEKIPLDKEVAYLQNYIGLQRLRVLSSPDIQIEVNIDESQCHHEIAPMLLIPFVENAFKHGISLRHRSRIVISLSCTAEQVFFDVYNSVHQRPENDPEREGMGIGLNNVKERLYLLYPQKHELSIRQTASEFFIHLTIDVK